MSASRQKILPINSSEANAQIIDLPAVEHPKQILILESEYLELKSKVGYWRSMFDKAKVREEKFKRIIKKLNGRIKDLTHRLFGKKSEKKSSKKDQSKPKTSRPKRNRGQQPGSKGHGRTKRPDLPVKEENLEFPETPICPCCNKPYIANGSKSSEIIEVDVKAYKRIIKCPSVKQGCTCKGVAKTITMPAPPKVLPRSLYGISIWEAVLLTKFHYSQPTNRLLNQYGEMGLPISPGTIAGGLKRLVDLFEPVYNALYRRQMTEDRFHNDESGWKVFESIEEKANNRWWLWVSRSVSVVYFQIAPGRGSDVPVAHFKNIEQQKIIVICDRYSAYKALVKKLPFIILAFCWAHVRRDFLDAARKYSALESWAWLWIERIGELYHLNHKRLKEFDPKRPFLKQSSSFNKRHQKLVEKMDAMVKDRDDFINSHPDRHKRDLLSDVKFKILTSLKNHWEGLSVFLEHPLVPMDNNPGEKSIRNPVTGRKNFYGSGSLWSAQLAAIMFSIFQTIALCGLNCSHWLRSYLTACAENHGKAPEDLSPFLPWEMDEDRRYKLSKPPDTS